MHNKNKLLILVGAPGAGKTVFANYFLRTEENWVRLCRDDFRTMNFIDGMMSKHEEILISEMIDAATETLLRRGANVLLDATHCRAEYVNHYIEKFGEMATISFKLFDVQLNELIERCEKRRIETGKYIPVSAIKRYFKELEEMKAAFDFSSRPRRVPVVATQDASLPRAIVCDLDGTLAQMNNRNPYNSTQCDEDSLNEPVAKVLTLFSANGYQILLVSGREEIAREPTIRFLDKYAIPYQHLWMRPNRDYRKDAVVKREIFNTEIAGRFFVEFVLDDRDQVVEMWRKDLKLNCFQVNYGRF
ncbi:MAG: AAA family ATPase [Bacteroidales bacterium]|jgi:predicted kinase|nr:AAA family ATPase [Bacteroidales bacterium]